MGEPTNDATGQHEDDRAELARLVSGKRATFRRFYPSVKVTLPTVESTYPDAPTMSAVALNILRRSPHLYASFTNRWPVRLYNEQSSAPPLGGIEPPLSGLRVVDLTRVLAGPTATMLLADLGADVIKVEEITRGDDTSSVFLLFRSVPHSPECLSGSWNPPAAPLLDSAPAEASHLPPESAYFLSINRNKRSITVDFKTPAGLKILHRLIKQSDIFIENFVSGKLSTVGLGWDDCRKINPRLIYASITGNHAVKTSPKTSSLISVSKGTVRQDHTGGLQDTMLLSKAKVCLCAHLKSPRNHLPGHASGTNAHVTVQLHVMFDTRQLICLPALALVNLTAPHARFALTTTDERKPHITTLQVGVASTDIATGLYAHGAIMAALISREKTGKGVWIDCNLFESQV